MAQHKASDRRSLRSALRHKRAADSWLDDLAELKTNIAGARAKVAADSNGSWDNDYESLWGVDERDWDAEGSEAQHKAPLRKVLQNALSHKKLANEVADIMEEAQVSLNAVLAQMDADSPTLSGDPTYEAYRIADVIDADAEGSEAQHKASFRRSMRSALSHRGLANRLLADMLSVQEEINALIDDIQAAN